MKNRDLWIIGLIVVFMFWRHKKNMNGTTTITPAGDKCNQHTCGGYPTPGTIAPQCPQGCKCGKVDPQLPDAPRKCVSI